MMMMGVIVETIGFLLDSNTMAVASWKVHSIAILVRTWRIAMMGR
jgi:hypothetical protein